MPSPLEQAFGDQSDLLDQIKSHISRTNSSTLFNRIADYINTLTRHDPNFSNDRSNKKRKLDDDDTPAHNGASHPKVTTRKPDWQEAEAYYNVKEVSFSVPQRKKLTLELSPERSYSYDVSSTGKSRDIQTDPQGKGGIRAINPTSGEVEFGMSWRDVGVYFAPLVEKLPFCPSSDLYG